MATTTDPLWRIDEDGALVFVPNPGQSAFIQSTAQEVLFSGHWGNGKSIAMGVKIWALAHLYPGIRGVLMRKVYADLRLSTLRHLRRVFGEAMWAAGVVGGERPERFDFPNGSSVDFIGIAGENGRTNKLLSTEYAFIAADECNELEEADWEMAMGRLRQPGIPIHQIFGCTNPDNPEHWLFDRFHPDMGSNRQIRQDVCDRCRGAGRAMEWVLDEDTGELSHELATCSQCGGAGQDENLFRECIVAGLNENDENQPTRYLSFKRNLTGIRRKRYFEGKWVAFEGIVYEDWDPNIHLCGPGTNNPLPAEWEKWDGLPPPDWERVVGIDFGYENPFVCEWFAISPDEHWYRYREIYMSARTIDLQRDEIIWQEALELASLRALAYANAQEEGTLRDGKNEWGGSGITPWDDWLYSLNVPARYADHDRGEREMLAKGGIHTTAADKDLTAGLQSVMRMLSPGEEGGAHLHLVRGCTVEIDERLLGAQPKLPTCLEQEVSGYLWDRKKSGPMANVARDLPVKKKDHALDALRYAVHSHRVARRVAVY